MSKNINVGGQAVIEGVMMRGSKGIATAVRTPEGSIEIDYSEATSLSKKNKFFGLPIIRGFISLIESLILGIKTLNYSASFFEDDEEDSKLEQWLKSKLGSKADDLLIGISLIFSFAFAIALFFITPTLLANLFKKLGASVLVLNILEGIIRVSIFLLYLYLVGKIEDINRVFQYHGAEHKTIFCYENNKELTVENVKNFGRLHPRCGTNFMFLVMIISILLFSITGWQGIWQRALYRILLLPLVSGITYEIIKWLGKSDRGLSQIVAYPGLKLQILTTKEPDESQIEVAIAALKACEGLVEKNKTIGEVLAKGQEVLKENKVESYIIDSQLLLGKVLDKDKLYLMTNKGEEISKDNETEFFKLINLRKDKMPVKYILKSCEFMGIELYVEQGVLIPRGDTEVLVETCLDIINENQLHNICDICCGSGAIGIALAKHAKNIAVDCGDISDKAKYVTEKNIELLGLEHRVRFYSSDLLKEFISRNEVYDMIVSNPPYIRAELVHTLMEDVRDYEPHLALDGGVDGLDFYRRITEESLKVLRAKGVLAFEIGHDQGQEVKGIMENKGFENINIIKDLAGHDRVVTGILKEP